MKMGGGASGGVEKTCSLVLWHVPTLNLHPGETACSQVKKWLLFSSSREGNPDQPPFGKAKAGGWNGMQRGELKPQNHNPNQPTTITK